MSRKKTHEEYVIEVSQVNPNIEVIGLYINNSTKILHRCKIDNNEWMARPSNILKGKGCPECDDSSRRKTHDRYVYDLAVVNNNIEVVGKYVNRQTPILHRCKIDGYEWYTKPNSILSGCGCPMCSGKKKTTESFKDELALINPSIEIVGEYINSATSVHCLCKVDQYEWDAFPQNLLRGCGCPQCAGLKHKTHEEYVLELSSINSNIEVVGQYINARTKILHRCKLDGATWMADPHHVLSGKCWCPRCGVSIGEQSIYDYLTKRQVLFVPQYTFIDCKNVRCLPFDFYLSELNACIEYDGIQHFQAIDFFGGEPTLKERMNNDRIKTEYCNIKNIPLLRIRYDDNITNSIDCFLNNLTIQN